MSDYSDLEERIEKTEEILDGDEMVLCGFTLRQVFLNQVEIMKALNEVQRSQFPNPYGED